MSAFLCYLCIALRFCPLLSGAALSPETKACLDCHKEATPGIVADWKSSRHAQTSVAEALKKPALSRRVSVAAPPPGIGSTVVGCAECHCVNPQSHADSFDHNGYQVHVVVTPPDCAVCHAAEKAQFERNLMAKAHTNLEGNPVFQKLLEAIDGTEVVRDGHLCQEKPLRQTKQESCEACHGTKVTVTGTEERDTIMEEMAFPVLSGWPNQGVGRINPDKSSGSCSACHARHAFSIEVARKPYTCAQCHKGPDVPAYKVYMVSKHGNIFASSHQGWDFSAVPWKPGVHFTAPTCAACHVSLLCTLKGEVLVERTHQMNDRNRWRLFGLPYAHPHPVSPDTTVLRNSAGLPLPADLTGTPAAKGLISPSEGEKRQQTMQEVCYACHSESWVRGRFRQLEHTVAETNRRVLAATQLLLQAYREGLAGGLKQGDSLFNEAIERKWVECWLFYANSVRFSAAMAGADYGVFANGRWYLARTIREMADWLTFLRKAKN